VVQVPLEEGYEGELTIGITHKLLEQVLLGQSPSCPQWLGVQW